MNPKNIELFQKNIIYPYVASNQREAIILKHMNMLKKGMTDKKVIEIMQLPDEVNLTYTPNKSKENNAVGFSLVYLLERYREKGSVIEKKEKLLRIHFDNVGLLISAYAINIQGFISFN